MSMKATVRETGTLLRVGPNTKGTTSLKTPTARALAGRKKVYPSVVDPSNSK